MTGTSALVTAVVVSLSLSTVLALVLTRPLRLVLNHICPAGDAVAFWLSFTNTMLYLAPLLFAMLFVIIPVSPVLVDVIRSALGASLAGAFAALLVVGYQISRARSRTA